MSSRSHSSTWSLISGAKNKIKKKQEWSEATTSRHWMMETQNEINNKWYHQSKKVVVVVVLSWNSKSSQVSGLSEMKWRRTWHSKSFWSVDTSYFHLSWDGIDRGDQQPKLLPREFDRQLIVIPRWGSWRGSCGRSYLSGRTCSVTNERIKQIMSERRRNRRRIYFDWWTNWTIIYYRNGDIGSVVVVLVLLWWMRVMGN